MTEDDLKPGAVVQFPTMEQPVELNTAIRRRDGSWFLMVAGNYSMVASPEDVCNARLLRSAKALIPVICDGRLTTPLYHGTNSVWFQSNREQGLAGRNVITEFRVIELLNELLVISDAYGFENPPGKLRYSAECIGKQKIGVEGWNYRHGSTYLCASPVKAAA